MSGLFGSSDFVLGDRDIVGIAWEAVRRRRRRRSRIGKRQRLDGTVEEDGYVTYKDYNDYMERVRREEHLDLHWDMRRLRERIKGVLLSGGWRYSAHHPETRFYPP